MMAARRVEVGEKVRIRHGIHKGKLGKVIAHERRTKRERLSWPIGRVRIVVLLTYLVEIDGVGQRRVPGSYLDLI